MKEKPPPSFFEVEPASGVLMPGQNMDVQVGFMPSEEVKEKKQYHGRLDFSS